ncbi:MAG: glycosyltransferase [Conexivisphaerales archaeon]
MDTKMSSITIGIPTRDRPNYLRDLLSALSVDDSGLLGEIIIYDNGTHPETKAVSHRYGAMYLRGLKKQPGGRNEILRVTKGEIIYFLDDDCLPCGNIGRILQVVWNGLSRANTVAVGGPVILSTFDCRPLVGMHDGRTYNRVLDGSSNLLEADHAQCWMPRTPTYVDFIPGGNMAFRTKELINVGGFDETFGRGTSFREETDPQLTLRQKGSKYSTTPPWRFGIVVPRKAEPDQKSRSSNN